MSKISEPREILGELEQLTMLAVLRLAGDAYGAPIRQELERTAARSVSIATVYVTLMRLEKKGHVLSNRSDPTPVRGGKAKRQFAVTPKGRIALVDCRAAFDRMWEGVDASSPPQNIGRSAS